MKLRKRKFRHIFYERFLKGDKKKGIFRRIFAKIKQRRKERQSIFTRIFDSMKHNLNDLSNTQISLIIITSMFCFIMIYGVLFPMKIEASSETVMNLINKNKIKSIAFAILTFSLMWCYPYIISWDMYHRKPQGKILQR